MRDHTGRNHVNMIRGYVTDRLLIMLLITQYPKLTNIHDTETLHGVSTTMLVHFKCIFLDYAENSTLTPKFVYPRYKIRVVKAENYICCKLMPVIQCLCPCTKFTEYLICILISIHYRLFSLFFAP
jgi:hypothetical protein